MSCNIRDISTMPLLISLLQIGKFVFYTRKKFFTVRSARLEKLPPPSPPHMKRDIFKYIFQILRASLAVARMAVFLRAGDHQHALHAFQSCQCLASALLFIHRQISETRQCVQSFNNVTPVHCFSHHMVVFSTYGYFL